MNYPKRLIEVDLPIKRISAHARREKSIRHGHISTLHIWWARRPLAACRAVICAALWPDPADPLCPDAFREVARTQMKKWARDHLDLLGEESFKRFVGFQKNPKLLEDNEEIRKALIDFIADFSNWDNSNVLEYLQTSRALTQAAHEALGGEPGTKPLVVDPFAGGGSIPLEALRVGADAFASDLNPVAVLINKVVLEYIPKYGKRLADEVRKWGKWIKEEAEKELVEFYPRDPDGATPIAYLWARTIKCEGPGCGAEVPLIRTLWLAKKGIHSVALRILPNSKEKQVDFEIIQDVKVKDVAAGTVRRGSVTCPVCGFTTPVLSVRRQLKERKGGAASARLFCVVIRRANEQGRFYRMATQHDLEVVLKASEELEKRKMKHVGFHSIVPDESTEHYESFVNRGPIYGMTIWEYYFTPRQALALSTLARLVRKAGKRIDTEYKNGLASAVTTCLAFALDKQADSNSSLCSWRSVSQDIGHTFGRQALPMMWDFVEANIFSGATRDWLNAVEGELKALQSLDEGICQGRAEMASATAHPFPNDAANAFITDPPYYYSVQYADLSDFFYVWLRRTIDDRYPEILSNSLTPKENEIIVQSPGHEFAVYGKNRAFYESRMKTAMKEGRRILTPHGIGVVVFAHTSTAGWESQLQAMVDAGWTVTGSWPIDTEMANRVIAQGRSVLASSVHLVCRPREKGEVAATDDNTGDWRDVLQELPGRIHQWMPRLAMEGVVGADAIFACLGPALEIFSRYSNVEKASGEQVTLKEYLEQVWSAVAKEALNMIFEGVDTTSFEEDARLTAMWLWTLSTGANSNGTGKGRDEDDEEDEGASSKKTKLSGFVLEYDAARKIAQGLGAHMEHLSSLVEIQGDKARLLPVVERTRHLFGKEEAEAPAARRKKKDSQFKFDFAKEVEESEEVGGWGKKGAPKPGSTVLDRIHQSMILFAAGRTEAMKRFLVEEGAGNDARFWRLAQALSALYPSSSEEKRWVDGILARKKGLGF